MRNFNLILAAILGIALMTACGGSKKVAQVYPDKETSPTRVKIEKEECEEETLKNSKGNLRGYGVGTSQDKMFARDQASMNARNEILNQIETTASNMIERYNQQHQASSENGLNRDETGRIKTMVRSLAEETLVGARVICSNTYMIGASYEVHVCIELTGENFVAKLHSNLTQNQKLMIDYEAEKFKEDFNAELEEYRKRKMGQ